MLLEIDDEKGINWERRADIVLISLLASMTKEECLVKIPNEKLKKLVSQKWDDIINKKESKDE